MFGCAEGNGTYCARGIANDSEEDSDEMEDSEVSDEGQKDDCAISTSCCMGEMAQCVLLPSCSSGDGVAELSACSVGLTHSALCTHTHMYVYRVIGFTNEDLASFEESCPGTGAAIKSTCKA